VTHYRTNPPHDLIRLGRVEDAPRYRAGWWIATNARTGDSRAEAYVMPDDETWADIYPASNWWGAMAKAIELAGELPGCIYEGGSDNAVSP
jgi:hypothetical protein